MPSLCCFTFSCLKMVGFGKWVRVPRRSVYRTGNGLPSSLCLQSRASLSLKFFIYFPVAADFGPYICLLQRYSERQILLASTALPQMVTLRFIAGFAQLHFRRQCFRFMEMHSFVLGLALNGTLLNIIFAAFIRASSVSLNMLQINAHFSPVMTDEIHSYYSFQQYLTKS